MNKRKLYTAVTAALCAVSLTACSVKFGTNVKPDSNAAAAKPTSGDFTEDMIITYGDFNKEYQYYLNTRDIADDTAESVAETCKTQRYSIISSLVIERIILHEAEIYGVSELTDEENQQAQDAYDQMISSMVQYYAAKAAENTGADSSSSETGSSTGDTSSAESLSAEDKEKLGNEALDKVLEKSGLTRDDLLTWQKNSIINTKLKEAVTKDSDYSKAEKTYDDYVEKIKTIYDSDIEAYQNNYYSTFWIPENSRYVKHILLGFDDETQTEIQSLRYEGKDDEANKLRSEKAEEMSDKLREVEEKLDSGSDWSELITEYSSDTAGSSAYPDGYLVIPKGTNYMTEFQEAAMAMEKVGDRTTCVTDYGVHIMLYSSDANISEEEKKEILDYIYSQQKTSEYSEMMEKWQDEFCYQIDYDMIRIDDPTAESSNVSGDSDSASSSETSVTTISE